MIFDIHDPSFHLYIGKYLKKIKSVKKLFFYYFKHLSQVPNLE